MAKKVFKSSTGITALDDSERFFATSYIPRRNADMNAAPTHISNYANKRRFAIRQSAKERLAKALNVPKAIPIFR